MRNQTQKMYQSTKKCMKMKNPNKIMKSFNHTNNL